MLPPTTLWMHPRMTPKGSQHTPHANALAIPCRRATYPVALRYLQAMESARENGLVVPGEYGWILSDGCTTQTQGGAYSTNPGLAYSMIGSICISAA